MCLLFTNRWARIAVSGALVAITSPLMSAAEQAPPQCQPAAALVRVPELPEGSGLAASRDGSVRITTPAMRCSSHSTATAA